MKPVQLRLPLDNIERERVNVTAMSCTVRTNRHGNLLLRIYWNSMESWEGTRHKDTPANRKLLEARALLISKEIQDGTFDYLKWFPEGNKAKLLRERLAPATRHTIQSYGETEKSKEVWLKDKRPPFVKKTRARNYRTHLNSHILPLLGHHNLDSFAFTHLVDFRNALVSERGVSVKTAKNIIEGTLRAMFRDAKAAGIIKVNPYLDEPEQWWPRMSSPRIDPFTESERDEILGYFTRYLAPRTRTPVNARDRRLREPAWPHAYVFVYLQFWTGARPSEWTARRWRDIDFRTGKLEILTGRTLNEEGETITIGSNRTIQLLPEVLEVLRLIQPLRVDPDAHILLNRAGRPMDQYEFGKSQFQGALRALGIRHRDFYNTRHTFISVQLSYGENPKQIAEYCGNSPEVIFRRYGRYIREHGTFGRAAMEASQNRDLQASENRDLTRDLSRLKDSKFGKVKGNVWWSQRDSNPFSQKRHVAAKSKNFRQIARIRLSSEREPIPNRPGSNPANLLNPVTVTS